MQEHTPRAPAEALAALKIVRDLLEGSLVAVYLHGSAVSGELRPQSDVDLLVVIEHPMTDAVREGLLAALMRISGRHPVDPKGPRCIELVVFLMSDLEAADYPPRSEFVYGEWLRDAFEAGALARPVADPELTLVLAQAREGAKALLGPAAAELLPQIPDDHVRRAMRDVLPSLLDTLAGDERNVLLTLARMWRTAATGAFVTKDAAANWAIPRLPKQIAEALIRARDAYLGKNTDVWASHQTEARRAADYLHRQVAAML
ncbi:aminoglycoside adenylyltransferase family protein [Rhodoligotrophos defluvii]|uniref:aminoglycoside adenylyltransferase family protein n=1 Tax=Rhodoligotrophos defluvii TaxID=2561934 RepID=UPI0010C9BD6C|nr:aminoglycoside adenylyltransferase family protein [Rhodoligotrophos defluvii]